MKIGTGILKIVATSALLGGFALGGTATAAGLMQVQHNTLSVVPKAKLLHPHDPRATLDISIALALRNQGQLTQFLHDLHDRNSPSYHKFLDVAQFTALYGPAQDQVDAVTGFLTSHGIKVTSVNSNHARVHARASVATLQSAFGIAINDYSYQGKTFYAASSDPSLPASLGHVVAVMGLENASVLTPHNIQNLHPAPRGRGAGPSGFSPGQIATAYNWPNPNNFTNRLQDTSLAAGVTIAIATAFTYRPQDIQKFWSTYGLPSHTLINVPIDGTTHVLNGETTLDIERSSSMSPGSTIKVYEASTPAFVSFDNEFQQIATDNDVQVVSTSWGSAEREDGGGAANASIIAEHSSFEQLAAQGITVMAAAGDNGADDSTGTGNAADFPSSDPFVLAAGGTTLSLDNNDNIADEAAWSGAGGADSEMFAQPDYQNDYATAFPGNWSPNSACDGAHTELAPSPGTAAQVAAAQACANAGDPSRQSSDMSMDANPGTGYSIYYNGRWEVFGGTSFVAPELAGFFAILSSQNGVAKNGVGPALVFCAAASDPADDFHDITSGSNGPGGVFDAGLGWDHPTGWGTPDAANLLSDLFANCVTH